MMLQCDDCRSSGPVLPEVVRVSGLVVRDWSGRRTTALSPMNKGHYCHLSQVVLNFERAYWMRKHGRARILNIFSLVASFFSGSSAYRKTGSHFCGLIAALVASEDKTPSRSGRCVPVLPMGRLAVGVVAALVLVMRAPVALSFLAAERTPLSTQPGGSHG